MKKAGTFFSKVRSLCREYIKTSLKGWLIFFSTLGVASAICAMLMRTTTSDVHVPLIFVLAVLIISLSTDGYFTASSRLSSASCSSTLPLPSRT